MTPEETARYHADRPGFDLLDFAEVGLPVYKVYIVASLLLHTPLPPIYEFVLRCVRLELDTPSQISACLGIPARMVEEVLRSLHAAEELTLLPRPQSDELCFALTRRGKRTVESLEQILPEQQTLPIYFDGLTRKPIAPPTTQLLAGRRAADLGLKEIPALPAMRIEVEDIDVTAAARLFRSERTSEPRRDLLSIKSIDRRLRLHLPATALVYRSKGGDEIELLFADQTKLLDEHTQAFALAEGPKKTRLLAELSKSELLGANSFARRVAKLERRSTPEQPQSGRRRLSLPGTILSEPPADTLTVLGPLDHAPLLREAIATARETLIIICPWITTQVIDAPMLNAIEAMLKVPVTFYLGYGFDDDSKSVKTVPPSLAELATRYPNFQLLRIGDTHEKVLIKDMDFAVLTSFNWLSFRGDPNRPLRRERGVKITDPTFVENEFKSMVARFVLKPPKPSRSVRTRSKQ
ncbi:hypothetical protein [Pseudochelatococcus contaminans]|uniref:Phospholipase D-like domain-containing protein n=1 Tax=Pseudochelatococcus contaminans TaxID=1538103 RepID=A0A7W5Z6G9_9HYPH|nr:hypothetical protein [Pseudochelatococcus contaminans]MBB3810579.1 hypothetical protein [Pseudochelatococcus contaminans]